MDRRGFLKSLSFLSLAAVVPGKILASQKTSVEKKPAKLAAPAKYQNHKTVTVTGSYHDVVWVEHEGKEIGWVHRKQLDKYQKHLKQYPLTIEDVFKK